MAAETLEGFEHESVEDEARFHVADAGTVGLAVLDGEGTPAGFALGEHRVAVPHQNDGSLVVGGLVCERHLDGVAEGSVGFGRV